MAGTWVRVRPFHGCDTDDHRAIEGSQCVAGQEPDVELALREALNCAVVHGNRSMRGCVEYAREVEEKQDAMELSG